MENARKKRVCFGFFVTVVILLSGCASSIVKKPDIFQVKKVAVLSLYADQKVPEAKGRGIVRDWDDKVRLQVAEDALIAFYEELIQMGWMVVPPTKVLQSKAYHDVFSIPEIQANTTVGKIGKFMMNAYQARFFTPAGMLPIMLGGDKQSQQGFRNKASRKEQLTKLGQMAKQLGVDAVVIIQIDYCYQGGTFSMLGSGEAVMTAGSSIKAVNQAGELVVNMPTVPPCGGENIRGKSTTSAPMVGGHLYFKSAQKQKFREMFTQATQASAVFCVKALKQAMSP
jgi:hypothetical protein